MQEYIDQIADVIGNPTSNLVVAALLLAAVTLIVLILILVALIFLMPSRHHDEDDEGDQDDEDIPEKPTPAPKREARKPLPRKLQIWLFVGITAATIATAYGVTSSDDYCANTCHVMAPSVASWNEGAHSGISCVRCHEGRLVVSAASGSMSRLRQLAAQLEGKEPVSAVVSSRTCLSCHAAQLEGSVETSSGIIVSHAEPLEAGMSCDTCHTAVAHEREVASQATIMTQCLTCHEGTKASAECSTCHTGDPGATPVFERIYTSTELPQPTCGGCHSEESCDACHGIRMPHSQAFIEGEHAKDAGFYRKEVCWNCHLKTDCGACHGDFDNSHPGDFFQTHKTLSRESTCNTCHRNHEGPFCDRCH
ncbi:MAG: hypothetical protein JXE06_01125 [Coriobacteriia bacterium]|nr:hypothetical protein [Coriobacteriia bacterium]MBN2822462.1 hypothetical protein [Coriobacteriia bacterium]